MATLELNEDLNVVETQSDEDEQDSVESDAMIKVTTLKCFLCYLSGTCNYLNLEKKIFERSIYFIYMHYNFKICN